MKSYKTLPPALKAVLGLTLLGLPAIAAFPNGYSYCKVVTVQHAMVSGANDLTNYPLTVVLTDPDLKTVPNGGLVNNNSGYDIAFYPDCSGSGAALKWEIESYTPATGSIIAHVLRPSLSHSVDDTIGMYFGGSFSTFQGTASAVWNAEYKGVWHLGNGTELGVTDSTSGANNGTLVSMPTATAAKVDGGMNLAAGQYVNVSNNTLGITGALTIGLWVKPASLPGNEQVVARGGIDTAAVISFSFGTVASKVYGAVGNGTIYKANLYGTTILTAGTWYHITMVYVPGTSLTYYLNGVQDAQSTVSIPAALLNSGTVRFGRTTDGTDYHFVGVTDEIRISNTARSADWILTEYRNQSVPGTYISVGPRIIPVETTHVRHSVHGGI